MIRLLLHRPGSGWEEWPLLQSIHVAPRNNAAELNLPSLCFFRHVWLLAALSEFAWLGMGNVPTCSCRLLHSALWFAALVSQLEVHRQHVLLICDE